MDGHKPDIENNLPHDKQGLRNGKWTFSGAYHIGYFVYKKGILEGPSSVFRISDNALKVKQFFWNGIHEGEEINLDCNE